MTGVAMGRGVSVFEMFRVVGRAGVASRTGTAEEITAYLRKLEPEQLIEEYHRAVVTLMARNLLTAEEKAQVAEYARDWIASQPMSRIE